jgi:AbrB family looped-hinge helix DNA binding protein
MLESTITPKGQVTISKAIRDRLGVKEGGKFFL